MENKFNPTARNYTKTNLVEVISDLLPDLYDEKDREIGVVELDPVDKVINANIKAIQNITSILPLSGVANTQTSSIMEFSGFAQYFVKQNELTRITPFDLESKILVPLGSTFRHFTTSAAFVDYLSGTLLPTLVPPSQTEVGALQPNISYLSALTGSTDASSVHNYLIDTLGWFYFLNTSGGGGLDYTPSSYVLDHFVKVFNGDTLVTVDGVKGFAEYMWRNNIVSSTWRDYGAIPTDFVSGTADSSSTYTSGTQRLDNYLTMLDVVFSPAYMDQEDYRVKNALDDYINTSTLSEQTALTAPTRDFLRAFSYSYADVNDLVENIGLIYDIENVRDEHLKYIAQLIGWRLYGNSPSKWRHQLRSAVEAYKKKGTLDGIQYVLDALISNTVLDVSGQVRELWETYIPHLIWYSLGTNSKLFRSRSTWTQENANLAGISYYDTSSLEENLKLAVDHVLLEMYEAYPENFQFKNVPYPIYEFRYLNSDLSEGDFYTHISHPNMKPFYMFASGTDEYDFYKIRALETGSLHQFEAATFEGPLGYGVYFAGEWDGNFVGDLDPYLMAKGDMNFVFNYRQKTNYPMPPFEEIKYYIDCSLDANMIDFIGERLECLGCTTEYVNSLKSFLQTAVLNNDDALKSLNSFLLFFRAPQVAPNYDDVLELISELYADLTPLFNAKSSHLFLNFETSSFDFAKTTLEGDSRYGLIEASRIVRDFTPAHAIPKVVTTASGEDPNHTLDTDYSYAGLDREEVFGTFNALSGAFANREVSGMGMSIAGGTSLGRGGLNTFQRDRVDQITDSMFADKTSTRVIEVPRRAARRRSLLNALPKGGYYDRTGFNGPVSFDASVLENSFTSSLGELTLGYVASAGQFHPVPDLVPSGVWGQCETLDSPRSFSGVDTSNTFPYRGLSSLGSNAKMPEEGNAVAHYIDRGQLPGIYKVMHNAFERQAYAHAEKELNLTFSSMWSNEVQSYANNAIASGLVLNDFHDYVRFAFGRGLHGAHAIYRNYFQCHPLGRRQRDESGGNIFAHVYGKGLYNGDFSISGMSAHQPNKRSLINSALDGSSVSLNDKNVFTEWYSKGGGGLMTPNFYGYEDWTKANGVFAFDGYSKFDWAPDEMPLYDISRIAFDYSEYTGSEQYIENEFTIDKTSIGREFYLTNFLKYSSGQTGKAVIQLSLLKDTEVLEQGEIYVNTDGTLDSTLTITSRGTPVQKDNIDVTIEEFTNINTMYSYTFKLTDYLGTATKGKVRILPLTPTEQSTVTADSNWNLGPTIVKGDEPGDYFAGMGGYVAKYPGQFVIPASGTNLLPTVETSSGTYKRVISINPKPNQAEIRNPNILSGVEFVATSGMKGAPFVVYNLQPSGSKKTANKLLNQNGVIRFNNVKGSNRIRFDLSSYGIRPNTLIPNHKYKLVLKALTANDKTDRLGGGKVAAWIHTDSTPGFGHNLLLQTRVHDKDGTYNANVDGLNRLSAARTGGAAGIIPLDDRPTEFTTDSSGFTVSASEFEVTSTGSVYNYIYGINVSGLVMDDQQYIGSVYVKQPTNGKSASGFAINLYDRTAPLWSYTTYFGWDGSGAPYDLGILGTINRRVPWNKVNIEPAGNGWYRVSIALRSDTRYRNNTKEHDEITLILYNGTPSNTLQDWQTLQKKETWFFGPQLETYQESTITKPGRYVERHGAAGDFEFDTPLYWSWTKGKWVLRKETDLSHDQLMTEVNLFEFPVKDQEILPGETRCLLNQIFTSEGTPQDIDISKLKEEFLETFEIEFDTFNETKYNNYEYQKYKVPDEYFKYKHFIHDKDTNYFVEIMYPYATANKDRYMLLESVELYDMTLGEMVSVAGKLEKDELAEVLKFYNGLAGVDKVYRNKLNSRDASITSGTLEVSGGSRLNYRIHPRWAYHETDGTYDQITLLEIDD